MTMGAVRNDGQAFGMAMEGRFGTTIWGEGSKIQLMRNEQLLDLFLPTTWGRGDVLRWAQM